MKIKYLLVCLILLFLIIRNSYADAGSAIRLIFTKDISKLSGKNVFRCQAQDVVFKNRRDCLAHRLTMICTEMPYVAWQSSCL